MDWGTGREFTSYLQFRKILSFSSQCRVDLRGGKRGKGERKERKKEQEARRDCLAGEHQEIKPFAERVVELRTYVVGYYMTNRGSPYLGADKVELLSRAIRRFEAWMRFALLIESSTHDGVEEFDQP